MHLRTPFGVGTVEPREPRVTLLGFTQRHPGLFTLNALRDSFIVVQKNCEAYP